MKYLYLLFVLPIVLWSCQNEAPKSSASAKQETPTQPAGEKLYPSIDPARLVMLWDSATNVDVIFYNLSFSLSQNKQQDIRGMINTIDKEVPVINPACQAIGRIFFVVDGRNAVEADMYFQDGCHYYVFMENGKPKYANNMTEAGVNFFTNVFNNVRTQMVNEQAKRQKAIQKEKQK